MKKLIMLFLVLITTTALAETSEFKPNTYYDPKPGIQKKCTPCVNGATSCRYAAWYGRFEPEGKVVTVCNEFDECSQVTVPSGGKWYEYFKWTHREHTCW